MKDTMERTIKVSDLKAVFAEVFKGANIDEKLSDEYAIKARDCDEQREKDWNSNLEYHHYGKACGRREAVKTIANMLGIYDD